ncbi:MAG: inositol monophosphatase [candidate division Zixibacteria bacterium]|nr:inositol monophosphatase [candidate division Zixibacteria bacterium]
MSKFLTIAKRAARAGASQALKYYEANVEVKLKKDRTPVTVADTEAEKVIIETIRSQFPEHAFFGEESGRSGRQSNYVWIIDPIDGTKNFIAGIPLWGTLIALMHRDEVIVGVSYLPVMNEMLVAEKGSGTWLNSKRVTVSDRSRLRDSMLSFGSLGPFAEKDKKRGLESLIAACKRHRCFGDCWPYHLLVAGKLEIVVEAAIKLVDVAPFVCIIKEAGGKSSDINGKPLHPEIDSFIATNGKLHRATMKHLDK